MTTTTKTPTRPGPTRRSPAIRRLHLANARAWRARSRQSPVDWIGSHVRLSEDFEGARAAYSFDRRPWWREPAEMVANPAVRYVRIKAATQVGKTLFLCAVICYLAENAPASAMVLVPDRDAATEFRDRLYALAAESGITIPARWRWNTRHCDIGAMRVYLAWPGSRSRMRSRRCKYVFRSEVDVYETRGGRDDPIEASNQRVKAFLRFAIWDESSPLPEPSRIDQLERDSDQRRWWCECPHCGRWQEVRFFPHRDGKHAGRGGVSGMYDEQNNLRSAAEVRKHAHYVCLDGCKITEAEQHRFAGSGRWVPRGQWIDRAGKLRGKPERGERELGYHLWAIHSVNATWGVMAAEYVTAKMNGQLPNFFGNWLGLAFAQKGKMPEWRELGSRMSANHRRGTVPAGAWFLTAGADVQDDEVYVSVRAWGDQRTSWLVDWYVFERQKGDEGDLVKSDLAQIEEVVLSAVYEIADEGVNPRGRKQLGVALLNIDGNHRTMDVHEWRRSLRDSVKRRVRIVRGEAQVKADEMYRMSVVEHAKRDKAVVYEGGLELWHLSPQVFRMDLAQRFRSDPDKPGAWYVTCDCMEQGEFYLRQVVNEPPVLVRQKDGRYKMEFRERDSTIGHDFWDCAVYESAAAQMIVDEFDNKPGWDASKWPKPSRPRAEQKRHREPMVAREFS